MTRIPARYSALVLILVTVLGVGYLALGVLRIDPTVRHNHVSVRMDHAAGLTPGASVVYRGVDIGTVEAVDSVPGGVEIRLSYDRAQRIPADAAMAVENLSALGEPVFAFLPADTDSADESADGGTVFADGGAVLADGDELRGTVTAPTSVPELLATSSTLLSQTDTDTVVRLVETFTAAVEHADTTAPALARAADVLARTLAVHQPSLEAVLRNLMALLPDVDWMKPVLTAAPPQLDAFGDTLGVSYEFLFEGSALLRGREVLGSWREEQQRFVDFLARLAPELGALGVALRPVTTATGPALGALDLATLLDQAMTALPGDHLRITLQPPVDQGPP
ncbi:MCE family protein [Nocardia farcinica]|uniref:MlaD family protein n=1 Tax=Nocardia farcinica TaxID=37329 RepID=UPI0018954A93|nr:MlaD family protein [Nocardia farcinica]MBF6260595.1 MCE family protein [Nocardia farcinica]MBF6279735.1 MCE family protein [Nocardia farcinica]MBF6303605.1 MCE family protein [Nocardia farcinica]MBF6388647.1 MCE family protein [Nocardia farcinica]MBF6493134.1 MCE family protein [Nocardia farcinica]